MMNENGRLDQHYLMRFANHRQYDVNMEDTALFSGHAKLPSGNALYEFLKVVSCALLVDMRSGTVIDATFTTLSPMTGAYISSLVIGWSFHDGIEAIEEKFEKQAHISSKKAFLKAIEVASQKFFDMQHKK